MHSIDHILKVLVTKKLLYIKLVIFILISKNVNAQWVHTNSVVANEPFLSMCTDPAGKLYARTDLRDLCSDSLGNVYGATANTIVKYDGKIWRYLGSENTCEINEVSEILLTCTDNKNNFYAVINDPNNTFSSYVAKYDGKIWSRLGEYNNYFNSYINAIQSDTSGNIYVGGKFNNINGRYIAKYDGTSWTEVGGNNKLNANGDIYAINIDKSGNIYVGGDFKNSNGNRYVAKYNGTSWTEVGGNNILKANGRIKTINRDSLGNLYIGGDFKNSNGSNYVAKYNGITWSELGGNNSLKAYGGINSIISDKLGNVFTITDDYGNENVFKYNGNSWIKLPTIVGSVYTLNIDNLGNIYAGGWLENSNGKNYLAKLNGNSWSEFYEIENGVVWSITFDNKNNIFLSGDLLQMFEFPKKTHQNTIKKYDGTKWTTLGIDSSLYVTYVSSICSDKNGIIYASVHDINKGKNGFIIRYKDKKWDIISDTLKNFGWLSSIHCDKYGNFYAYSNKYIMKFDGNLWSRLGGVKDSIFVNSIFGGNEVRIHSDNVGNIYVGNMRNSDNLLYIAKFDGNSWTELGGKNSFSKLYIILTNDQYFIYSIKSDKKGNIYVGSNLYNLGKADNYVAKFDGTSWSELGGTNTLIDRGFNFGQANLICLDTFDNIYVGGSLAYLSNGKYYIAKYVNNINTAITNSIDKELVSIYPNPAKDRLVIDFGNFPNVAGYEINIFDVTGKTVYNSTINKSNETIDLNTWTGKGVYFIKIYDKQSQQIENRKIVIQ